jgi:predicted metalloendopeptidase
VQRHPLYNDPPLENLADFTILVPTPFVDIDVRNPRIECVKQTVDYMALANAKVFTDYMFSPDAQTKLISNIGKIFENIKHTFRAIVDEVNWLMDEGDLHDRTAALEKISSVQLNFANGNFKINSTDLDAFYAALDFKMDTKSKDADDYFSLVDKLKIFDRYSKIRLIDDVITYDLNIVHSIFVGASANLESWYSLQFNNITLPEGLLQSPYYNPNWPTSINYGAIGFLIAHEFAHALDDRGIYFNKIGLLEKWMHGDNLKRFNEMNKCVVDEYSNFKVLPDEFSPNTINGALTLGENMADNTGIHAAFRAYRNYMALNGQAEPQLPDRTLRDFTHDQLFFMSFARMWCQNPAPSDDNTYQFILSESHSPPRQRVFGTLQNFPAFRQAFNCPSGSAYAPENYCKVWTPRDIS